MTVMSPGFLKIFEPLQIIDLLDPAFHCKFGQCLHHLANRHPAKFSGFAQRHFAIPVFFDGQQDSATGY
jgi:hypothetical protein